MKLKSFSPWEEGFFDDPYPFFDRLRENEPVHWSDAFDGWVITSYDLVKEVSMSNLFSSDKLNLLFNRLSLEQQEALEPILENMRYWAIMLDGDDHKRIRSVLNKTFTSKPSVFDFRIVLFHAFFIRSFYPIIPTFIFLSFTRFDTYPV